MLFNIRSIKSSKTSSCSEVILRNEIYTDLRTGCMTRKRVKQTSCRSECKKQTRSMMTREEERTEGGLEKFQLLDKNAQFSYLIGTNKRAAHLRRHVSQPDVLCCQPIKRRTKKLRLFCPNGSSYITEIDMIKKCICAPLTSGLSRCPNG